MRAAGLGPWAGFVCGWLYWYFWVVVVGIEAIAGAAILQTWIPAPVWQIGLVLMVLLTATNLLSTRSYGEFEFWFASIKVAAIVAFIAIGGQLCARHHVADGLDARQSRRPRRLCAVRHGGRAGGSHGHRVLADGRGDRDRVAAESSEPSRAIAALTTSLIVRILLFYVGSVLVILAVVPWTEIAPGSSPFALALERMAIPFAATTMNLIVLVAVLSCLNSGLYVTSRMLFGLAAHGDAPRSLVALDARGVPTRAILIGTVFGYLAVLASVVSPQRLFTFLVNASGAIMLVIYLLIALAQIRRRGALEREAPGRLVIRMWLSPLVELRHRRRHRARARVDAVSRRRASAARRQRVVGRRRARHFLVEAPRRFSATRTGVTSMRRALLALAAALAATVAGAAPPEAPARQFTGLDLFGLQVATDPQIRPDGAVVAYTRVSYDVMTDGARRSIWLVDVATGEQTPLITGCGVALDAALVARRQAPRLRVDGRRGAPAAVRALARSGAVDAARGARRGAVRARVVERRRRDRVHDVRSRRGREARRSAAEAGRRAVGEAARDHHGHHLSHRRRRLLEGRLHARLRRVGRRRRAAPADVRRLQRNRAARVVARRPLRLRGRQSHARLAPRARQYRAVSHLARRRYGRGP